MQKFDLLSKKINKIPNSKYLLQQFQLLNAGLVVSYTWTLDLELWSVDKPITDWLLTFLFHSFGGM